MSKNWSRNPCFKSLRNFSPGETVFQNIQDHFSKKIIPNFRDALGNHLDIPEKHGINGPKRKKEYAPHVNNNADLPTILEAHQFLIKKFVIDPRERKHRMDNIKNLEALAFGDTTMEFRRKQQRRSHGASFEVDEGTE